jgi:hypothetical protein
MIVLSFRQLRRPLYVESFLDNANECSSSDHDAALQEILDEITLRTTQNLERRVQSLCFCCGAET